MYPVFHICVKFFSCLVVNPEKYHYSCIIFVSVLLFPQNLQVGIFSVFVLIERFGFL